MSAFWAIIGRDLRLATRSGGDVLTLILFFVMVGAITPFAIGPDIDRLRALAPGIIWIAAFLAMLLGLDRLFRADEEDGSLLLLFHARIPLEGVVVGKMVAHWVLAALPLIIAMPILAILLDMDWSVWSRTLLALMLGTPGLTAFGTIGAAVTVSIRRGGLLAPILILPLSIPLLIFGVATVTAPPGSGAAMLFLSAFSLLAVAFCPFAAALALRSSGD